MLPHIHTENYHMCAGKGEQDGRTGHSVASSLSLSLSQLYSCFIA